MTPEEVKKLLQESNEEDYKKIRSDIERRAKKPLPDNTPVYYVACKYNGFEAVGYKLSILVEFSERVIAGLFDTFTWKAKNQGPVHALVDIMELTNGINHNNLMGTDDLIEESTLGDKETFFKYINAMVDYYNERRILCKDPKELVKK